MAPDIFQTYSHYISKKKFPPEEKCLPFFSKREDVNYGGFERGIVSAGTYHIWIVPANAHSSIT
jgi:hypothetical protein